ncbi:uncharacterized protein [Phaseolus vulgaris]|uniref:uncharacterized protein n=1 Tax=Phaseolus vulgaris TaxID=3885 RepID=UPI0035CBC1F9
MSGIRHYVSPKTRGTPLYALTMAVRPMGYGYNRPFCSRQRTISVEHPQTNGQAEAANKAILNGLKKHLGPAKGNWTEELLEVLRAYRCTPQTTTQETPYSLMYGTEAMIPVEIGEPSIRRQTLDLDLNNESLSVDLDLINELRDKCRIREEACKIKAARRYNSKVKPRQFHKGDLV